MIALRLEIALEAEIVVLRVADILVVVAMMDWVLAYLKPGFGLFLEIRWTSTIRSLED